MRIEGGPIMLQVVISLISTLGALGGVALGAILLARAQARAWRSQEVERSTQERRRTYAEFLAAARIWRATVMSPDARIVAASTFSKSRHADGGYAAISTLRLRIEVDLIAQKSETTRCARTVFEAVRRLAEARGEIPAGQVPDEVVEVCRKAEEVFAVAARLELASEVPGLLTRAV
jgi:hypothetical protein